MDKLLLLGMENPKLGAFLKKMGYELLREDNQEALVSLCEESKVDLIVINSSKEKDGIEICRFIKNSFESRSIPVVYIAAEKSEITDLTEEGYHGIEFMESPYSPGLLVSKIATNLRLKKMAGGNEESATLSEINLKLRDLNSRFTKELEEARKIQQTLIPASLPQSDKLDIAVKYIPLEHVGGDWYYVDELPDKSVSVQIGDVTGHGLSAAFIGSMAKLAKTAAATDFPGELIKKMNALLANNIPEGNFITFFSYLINPEKGTLSYARAGHTPGLHYKASSGKVERLLGDGFALGFFEDSDYEEIETTVETGDVLVVFTDGYPEAQNRNGDVYDYDRMEQIIARDNASSSQSILEAISKDFELFCEGRLLKDDLTLIVTRVIG